SAIDAHAHVLVMHVPLRHWLPIAHVCPASSTHWPLLHREVVGSQGLPPAPHWHRLVTLQRSAVGVTVSHWATVAQLHLPRPLAPAPLPQVQLPPLQASEKSGSHMAHAAPPVPQLVVLVLVTQLVPLQQPVGQPVASHTHAPATQCWPLAHGGFAPHLHAPAV